MKTLQVTLYELKVSHDVQARQLQNQISSLTKVDLHKATTDFAQTTASWLQTAKILDDALKNFGDLEYFLQVLHNMTADLTRAIQSEPQQASIHLDSNPPSTSRGQRLHKKTGATRR